MFIKDIDKNDIKKGCGLKSKKEEGNSSFYTFQSTLKNIKTRLRYITTY
jgi:hypothetical protein